MNSPKQYVNPISCVKPLLKPLAACMMLAALSSTSLAYVITDSGSLNGTDVGGLDGVLSITSTLANSNPTTETTWVNSVLGGTPGLQYSVKDEDVSLHNTDGSNVFAFSLSEEPGYYLIKNAKAWALMSNAASLEWGVFQLADLEPLFDKNSNGKLDDWVISHVIQFSVEVSEPGSIALVGLGLAGLVFSRRRLRTTP